MGIYNTYLYAFILIKNRWFLKRIYNLLFIKIIEHGKGTFYFKDGGFLSGEYVNGFAVIIYFTLNILD